MGKLYVIEERYRPPSGGAWGRWTMTTSTNRRIHKTKKQALREFSALKKDALGVPNIKYRVAVYQKQKTIAQTSERKRGKAK
jgi:hypothetical protein